MFAVGSMSSEDIAQVGTLVSAFTGDIWTLIMTHGTKILGIIALMIFINVVLRKVGGIG